MQSAKQTPATQSGITKSPIASFSSNRERPLESRIGRYFSVFGMIVRNVQRKYTPPTPKSTWKLPDAIEEKNAHSPMIQIPNAHSRSTAGMICGTLSDQ